MMYINIVYTSYKTDGLKIKLFSKIIIYCQCIISMTTRENDRKTERKKERKIERKKERKNEKRMRQKDRDRELALYLHNCL